MTPTFSKGNESDTISNRVCQKGQRNLWYYEATVGVDEKGKRIRKKKRFKTKKETDAALADLLSAANKGEYIEPSKVLYKDYIKDWLESKKLNVKSTTWESYRLIVDKHIIPAFGNYEVSKLTPQVVERYFRTMSETHAGSTLQKIYTLIKDSLNKAERWQMVSKNVVNFVDRPRSIKEEIQVWTKEQAQEFLQVVRGERLYICFLLALTTGMRQGEILGLRWKDIDFENQPLYVKQTLDHVGNNFLSVPKTAAGRRSITFPNEVVSELIKHRELIKEEKNVRGVGYVDKNLVVCTTHGKPYSPANLLSTFKRLISKTTLPTIRFHDLRHTHANIAINARVVSERLGHETIKITLDTYTHVFPSLQRDTANEFGKMFF